MSYRPPEICKTAGELQAAGLELYDLVLNPLLTAGSCPTVTAAATRRFLITTVVSHSLCPGLGTHSIQLVLDRLGLSHHCGVLD